MPRPRLGFLVITQTHLEKIDSRHWKLTISDGVLFFPSKNVRCYIVGTKALEQLYKQIEEELEENG